jgi:hypothetical protein
VGDLLGYELFGQVPFYTTDVKTLKTADGARVNYDPENIEGSYQVWPSGLLGETGTRNLKIPIAEWKGTKVLFPVASDHSFDIFSAIFYLLSRYEEYLPHEEDEYGRYSHTNALAWRENFLDLPLVDQWIAEFGTILKEKFPTITLRNKTFKFLPTYDIDEAWSFRYKPFLISVGGMLKDVLKGKISRVRRRSGVRKGKIQDPFDAYDWMDDLHREFKLDPVYFFLVAAKRGKYDRNIPPTEPAFRELVKNISSKYRVGVHPSWQSGDRGTERIEKELLEEISGKKINNSRQHFIRFKLPATYRRLISSGITDEYSMGYGSVNGFRASASFPFYWYDLEKEQQTSLRIHPFCFMDANSFFEEKQAAAEAREEMKAYYQKVKKLNGCFSCIWHNTFLGTDPLFKGWREAYRQGLESFL